MGDMGVDSTPELYRHVQLLFNRQPECKVAV
jgi:hypothetical protein